MDEDEDASGNLILAAYEEFVQDLAQIFRDVCKSNFVQLELIVTRNWLDSRWPMAAAAAEEEPGAEPAAAAASAAATNFFDRICTGIAADVVGTDKLLQSYVSCLNNRNPLAAILTFHRIWRRNNMHHHQSSRYVHH